MTLMYTEKRTGRWEIKPFMYISKKLTKDKTRGGFQSKNTNIPEGYPKDILCAQEM